MAVRYALWDAYVGDALHGGVDYYRYIYYSTFCRFDELVGRAVVLALLRNYHAGAWKTLTARGNLVFVVGGALLAPACWWFLNERESLVATMFGYPLLALGFGLLILAALGERSLLRRIRVPGAASLALWSYAIYLVHKQLCILAREPIRALGYGPDTLRKPSPPCWD
ncbi:hypothetical protein LP419_01900 [Massilia sp. H-1]|nr:hypothetical protein LP419_01900 [Massilia sp. H-1]